MASDPLEKYLDRWDLRLLQKIASSTTSEIYKVEHRGTFAILKILSYVGQQDEAHGAHALKIYNGCGSIRLLESDDSAHLLEFVDGNDLGSLYRWNGDRGTLPHLVSITRSLHSKAKVPKPKGLRDLSRRLKNLVEITYDLRSLHRRNADRATLPHLISVTRSLHLNAKVPKPKGFRDLTRRFEYLFETADRTNDKDTKLAARIARELIDSEQTTGILHGDLHHGNILFSSERGWLAIDPKGLYGELTFDVAIAFYHPMGNLNEIWLKSRVQRLVDAYHGELGLDRERIIGFAFAYGHLSASWMKDAGLETAGVLAIAKTVQELIYQT
jgi:streptomycin 6-kinase